MKLTELTEDEIQLVLEYRGQQKKEKEKSFFRKYIFNKYVIFDLKQSVVRESIRAIFLLYIIERLKHII